MKYNGKEVVLSVARDITNRKKAEFERLKEGLIPEINSDIIETVNKEFKVNFSPNDLNLQPRIRNLAELNKSTDPSQVQDLIVSSIRKRLKRADVDVDKENIREAITVDFEMFLEEIIGLAEDNYVEIPSQFDEFLKELKE